MLSAADLNVVIVLSNPVRYQRRTRLAREALHRAALSGATVWFVEAVFGERAPEVADPKNRHHVIVRCDDEIWLKENLINIGVSHFPANWKYMMWLDGDVEFLRPNWAMEVLHGLQHYQTLQPFSHVADLGPNREILETHTGFGYLYLKGAPFKAGYGTFWHPGYAWAWRREAFDAVGGMIDRAICGAADHHMATALIGRGPLSVHGHVTPAYLKMVTDWQIKAEIALERNLGCIEGTILHYFHGAKAKRNYVGRWDILIRTNFDPNRDLEKDERGVLNLPAGRPYLRDQIRAYFRSRDEDGGL